LPSFDDDDSDDNECFEEEEEESFFFDDDDDLLLLLLVVVFLIFSSSSFFFFAIATFVGFGVKSFLGYFTSRFSLLPFGFQSPANGFAAPKFATTPCSLLYELSGATTRSLKLIGKNSPRFVRKESKRSRGRQTKTTKRRTKPNFTPTANPPMADGTLTFVRAFAIFLSKEDAFRCFTVVSSSSLAASHRHFSRKIREKNIYKKTLSSVHDDDYE
jgi:hypothetical protein